MNVYEVFKVLNDYAPLNLSDDILKFIGGDDNSGIIAPTKGEITGVVFTLDLTIASVEKAKEIGANLIVTHHPAIYPNLKKFDYDSALLECLNNKIGVISMHLNLDCAKFGIDYYLATALSGDIQKILNDLGDNCGYGRVYEVDKTLNELKNEYKKVFNTDKIVVYGNLDKKIKKVASFCGSGLDIAEMEMAKDCDLYISSDVKHHVILYALEKGKAVMNVSHYSSEVYGFKKFYNSVKDNLKGIKSVFVENEDMI
jgi:dinuclear metal center YbgI/SA1388 family protein